MLKESISTDELEDKQLQQCRGYDQLDASSKDRVRSICKKYAKKFHNSEQKINMSCMKNLKKAKDESIIDNVGKFS